MTQVQSHNSFPIALSFLEVASSICSIVVVTWGIVPLKPGAMWLRLIPFLLIFIQSSTSQILRGETLKEIGLTAHHLAVASKLLIPQTQPDTPSTTTHRHKGTETHSVREEDADTNRDTIFLPLFLNYCIS